MTQHRQLPAANKARIIAHIREMLEGWERNEWGENSTGNFVAFILWITPQVATWDLISEPGPPQTVIHETGRPQVLD